MKESEPFDKEAMLQSSMRCDCRASFSQMVATWRRRSKRLQYAALAGLLLFGVPSLLASLFWPDSHLSGAVGFIVCFAILVVGSFAVGKLECPACEKNVRSGPERYCPECGAGGCIRTPNIFSSPHCELCNAKFPREKSGPRYKIKCCTHCGAHLSDEGV